MRADSVSSMERYGVRCVIAANSQLQFQLQNDMSIDGIAGSSTRQKAATISAYADNRKNWGKPYIGYKCADKKASMSESEVVASMENQIAALLVKRLLLKLLLIEFV